MENNTSVVMHVVMANNKDSGEFYRGKTPTHAYSVNLRDDISAVKSTTILAVRVLLLAGSEDNMPKVRVLTVHPIYVK